MPVSATDSIVQDIVINAPIERVWRAVSDSTEFGEWFGLRCDRPFEPGVEVGCAVTKPDEFAGTFFPIWIEEVSPPTRFSFRWHAYAVQPEEQATATTTLVTFTLEPHPEGTLLTIVESGFDDVPLDRRAEAFASNSEGWRIQSENIAKHVAAHA